MQSQLALSIFVIVKRVTEKLLPTYGARTSLIAVNFQEKLTFNKLGYTLQYTFGGTLTPAEYHTVISVAYKRMTATGQFLVQFVEQDVAQ